MSPDQELLARLRDVHAPGDPHWWPPAPGWWLLALLALIALVLLARYLPPLVRRWRRRRRLLSTLRSIERYHRSGASAAAVAAAVSELLRRAALERFPEHRVAGLHGTAWISFLESRDRIRGRFTVMQEALTVAPYQRPEAIADCMPLLHAARGWLRAVL
jgi:hypothetical protein